MRRVIITMLSVIVVVLVTSAMTRQADACCPPTMPYTWPTTEWHRVTTSGPRPGWEQTTTVRVDCFHSTWPCGTYIERSVQSVTGTISTTGPKWCVGCGTYIPPPPPKPRGIRY